MASEDPGRRRLGRGLAALIGEIERPEQAATERPSGDFTIKVERIHANPRNPRRQFPEAELSDLANSIRQHGLVQPVVVRPLPDGTFELIAGERRWRAAQQAGLTEVPAIVRPVDDRTSLELAIVENVQRADLNPVEEALGYERLIEEYGYSQAELGQVVGKSRSHVANTLRLLKLPEPVRAMLAEGTLSAGHARALITAEDPTTLARRIVEQGMSVRQAEAAVQPAGDSKNRVEPKHDPDRAALEKLLSDATGLKVSIKARRGGGELSIAYKSLEQLDELCRKLQS